MQTLQRFRVFVLLVVFFSPRPGLSDIERVWLIPFTHLDVGFTGSLDHVAMKSKDRIDQALELCGKHEDFRWTIESLWEFEQWRIRSSEEDVLVLMSHVRSGQVEICALPGTFRSGLLSPEAAYRAVYGKRQLEEEFGIEIVTAMQNDVPGYSGIIAEALGASGVRYFVTGTNLGHGGGALIPYSDMPFRWEWNNTSVLTWIDHEGYVSTTAYGIMNIFERNGRVLPDAGEQFRRRIKRLEDEGYDSPDFMILASLGDNRSPEEFARLIEGVADWNAEGNTPEIRFGTPREFFKRAEAAKTVPSTYTGNWNGIWDARLWNPAANGLARNAAATLRAGEILASLNSMLEGSTYPAYDLEEGWRALQLHAEHTCGGDPSWIGLFNPFLFRETSESQNVLTLRFAQNAWFAGRRVLLDALETAAKGPHAADDRIVVFNPGERTVDVVAECKVPRSHRRGHRVPQDLVAGIDLSHAYNADRGTLRFVLKGMKPLERRTIPLIQVAKDPDEGSEVTGEGVTIENDWYAIECGGDGEGLLSIVDKETGRDLVRAEAGVSFAGLCEFSFQEMNSDRLGKRLVPGSIVTRVESAMDLKLVIERSGSFWKRTEITLPLAIKRIDLTHEIDRSLLPHVSAEEHSRIYSIPFPLELEADGITWRVDGPGGFHTWPDEYLPGTTLGVTQSTTGVHVQEESGFAVAIASSEAFNWCIGSPNMMRAADLRAGLPKDGIASGWGGGPDVSQLQTPIMPTLYSLALQHASEGWSADEGRSVFRDIEPGADGKLIYGYSITTWESAPEQSEVAVFLSGSVMKPVSNFFWGGDAAGPPKATAAEEIFHRIPKGLSLVTLKRGSFDHDLWVTRWRAVEDVVLSDFNFGSGVEGVMLLDGLERQISLDETVVADLRLTQGETITLGFRVR